MSRFYDSPPWRWVVTDFNGATLTFLDQLALRRQITYTLNDAAIATCDLPSDNSEIDIADDGEPFVSFNDKLLYCFRREDTDPSQPYVIRFAGKIDQLNDEVTADTATPTTHLTAYDPWHYLDSRPVLMDNGTYPPQETGRVFAQADGWTPDAIAVNLLTNAVTWANPTGSGGSPGPAAAQECFIDATGGTIETLPVIAEDFNVLAGTSVGEAWRQLVQTGYCDIVLTPIYDVTFRPGLLCTLNIYALAGSVNNTAIFSWDMAGRSLIGINRLQDGSTMANVIQYYGGQGGGAVASPQTGMAGPVLDPTSLAKYGPYWLQQSWPGQEGTPGAVGLAALAQLLQQRFGVDTLTVDPAPESSPVPLMDYQLGDRVPVWADKTLRLPINPSLNINGLWDYLWRVGTIPIQILDDGPEMVQQLLLVSPGDPPPGYRFTPIVAMLVSENGDARSPSRKTTSKLSPPVVVS